MYCPGGQQPSPATFTFTPQVLAWRLPLAAGPASTLHPPLAEPVVVRHILRVTSGSDGHVLHLGGHMQGMLNHSSCCLRLPVPHRIKPWQTLVEEQYDTMKRTKLRRRNVWLLPVTLHRRGKHLNCCTAYLVVYEAIGNSLDGVSVDGVDARKQLGLRRRQQQRQAGRGRTLCTATWTPQLLHTVLCTAQTVDV